MTPENQRAAETYLKAKGITTCPICKGGPLSVKPQVGALVPIVAGAIALNIAGMPLLPIVTVKCNACAHLMNFAATDMGVTP